MPLDGATNDHIQGEQYGLNGISTFELVYGVQNAQIVRAAFLHTSQFGSRFNDPTRGAWYPAVELVTSISEVTYHEARRLAEIVPPNCLEIGQMKTSTRMTIGGPIFTLHFTGWTQPNSMRIVFNLNR